MSDPYESTSTGDGVPFSSTFLEFCAKVRNSDPSILPGLGEPSRIGQPSNNNLHLSDREHMELADALLGNTNVTYIELETGKYTKVYAEAITKYVRTSKQLQRIRWLGTFFRMNDRALLQQREEMLCCFLPAFQESMSVKESEMNCPLIGGLSPGRKYVDAYPELTVSESTHTSETH